MHLLLKDHPIDAGSFEIGKIILPVTLDFVFENFLKMNGDLAYKGFYTKSKFGEGFKDFEVTEVMKIPDNEKKWKGKVISF